MPEKANNFIHVKGAKVHNLKNISISIPRNKFIVITGVSGSGKSSLAFNTLYAEGQRRYVESLSSYARQFLGKIEKPDVDIIEGIPPSIAIEQKVSTYNPRSTVGTSTEIYDYIKLLYARIGKTYSPVTNREIKKHTVKDVVSTLLSADNGSNALILAPIENRNGSDKTLQLLAQQGFSRIETDGEIAKIDAIISSNNQNSIKGDFLLVVDRVEINTEEDNISRIADSIELAFYEGKGKCKIRIEKKGIPQEVDFSSQFEEDGVNYEEPSVHLFSFNNPLGACPKCEGFGQTIGIDEELVIPNQTLSVYDGAVAPWTGEKMSQWKDQVISTSGESGFPIHKPYNKLSADQLHELWNGSSYFGGINKFFSMLEKENHKIQYRVMLARYRGKTTCPECHGRRLRKEAEYIKINDIAITDLVELPMNELKSFFDNLGLSESESAISKRLLIEIKNRINFLLETGLSYLSLNRKSSTLSGGESQRINLSTSLGSSLVGSLYILDEPSIGLHPKDTERLTGILKKLQKTGNTVLVVEHDEDIMMSADQIIDIGPLAGSHGGEIVFQGNLAEKFKEEDEKKSLTLQYLNHKLAIPVPESRRIWKDYIQINGAHENNLKNIDVKIPLHVLTVITGVSGSGKSSLIRNIFYPALKRKFGEFSLKPGKHDSISGDIHLVRDIEFVDQNPIGRSSRSNPVTYLKIYDEIRKLFSDQPYARMNGFKPSHFSFNVDGGRCEECQGEGTIKVEMQFMADIELTCESCKGKRFKDDVLDVLFEGKSIHDILEMTIDDAIIFFSNSKDKTAQKIGIKLKPLCDVGLGYVKTGQSSSTLSGGESQRIKLALFLSKEKDFPMIFVFDEPTTGLHFHDIQKLLDSFDALIKRGHTIVIIEHNPEIIKCADWIIDLGPEGGKQGGYVVFEGTPEAIISKPESYTGEFLARKLTKL